MGRSFILVKFKDDTILEGTYYGTSGILSPWIVEFRVRWNMPKKAAEIEAQLKRYNKDYENSRVYLISGTGFLNRIRIY